MAAEDMGGATTTMSANDGKEGWVRLGAAATGSGFVRRPKGQQRSLFFIYLCGKG
jgi:hypothetical protein